MSLAGWKLVIRTASSDRSEAWQLGQREMISQTSPQDGNMECLELSHRQR